MCLASCLHIRQGWFNYEVNQLVSSQSAQKSTFSLLGEKMLDCWKGEVWKSTSVGAALN